MKLTRHVMDQLRGECSYIQLDWIAQIIEDPDMREVQPDGCIRFWGWVPYPDRDNLHALRVVTLEDRETVVTAFVDSSFTRRGNRGNPLLP